MSEIRLCFVTFYAWFIRLSYGIYFNCHFHFTLWIKHACAHHTQNIFNYVMRNILLAQGFSMKHLYVNITKSFKKRHIYGSFVLFSFRWQRCAVPFLFIKKIKFFLVYLCVSLCWGCVCTIVPVMWCNFNLKFVGSFVYFLVSPYAQTLHIVISCNGTYLWSKIPSFPSIFVSSSILIMLYKYINTLYVCRSRAQTWF